MDKSLLLNKLEKSIRLQQHCLDVIAYEQGKERLRAFQRSRVKQLLLLIFSNIVIGYFMAAHYHHLFFMISGGMLMLFNVIGMAGTVRQMIIIHQQGCWENLAAPYKYTGLLQTVVLLQTVMIRSIRIRFFAWPLYSVYILIGLALSGWDFTGWWQLQIGVVVLLLPVSIWMYKKVRLTNLHIKWVVELLNQAGRRYLQEVMGFYPSTSSIRGSS